jgi:hypothetical protein
VTTREGVGNPKSPARVALASAAADAEARAKAPRPMVGPMVFAAPAADGAPEGSEDSMPALSGPPCFDPGATDALVATVETDTSPGGSGGVPALPRFREFRPSDLERR